MRKAAALLMLLAFGVLLAWALPQPREAAGVAGYGPLHTLLETIAVVIAALIFAAGWSAYRGDMSGNTVLLACAFAGVALLDFSHALSFAGMPDYVTPSSPEKAINFWLAARLLAALALLTVALMPWRSFARDTTRYALLASVLAATAFAHWLFLFHPEVVPRTFVAGLGLTPFKVTFEYALIALGLTAAFVLWRRMRTAQPFNVAALFIAVCTMAMSEFFFTLYSSVTDVYNLMGHLYKVISYLFLYRALFVETVERPFVQLQAAQSQLRSTLETIPDLLWLKDVDGVYLDCNPRFERLFGATRADIVGKTDADFVSKELAAFFREHDRRAMAAGKPTTNEEWLTFAADGYHGLFETIKTPMRDAQGKLVGVLGIARDITAAHAAQRDQQSSEQRLQQAVRVAHVGIFEHDHLTDTVYWSPEQREFLGVAPDVKVDLAWILAHVHPDDVGRTGAAVQRAHDPMGEGLFDVEHRIVRSDGELRVLQTRSRTLFAGEGIERRPIRTIGATLDVTEHKRAEEVLRVRDRALTQISQGVVITDRQRIITYMNPGFEQITGYSAAEAIGRDPRFLQGAGTSPATVAEIGRALRAGETFRGEILNVRKDGRSIWVALDISPMRDESGTLTGHVGTQRDITEQRQAEAERRALESQLRESQKMESIGNLAGGIAHDFNNILGAILGNVALARSDLAGTAAQQSLDQIHKAGVRARDLVQQILTFSRRQPQKMAVQALQPLLTETLSLLRSTLPAGVGLEARMTPTPLYLNADATQMQQVVMNLCTNAWHALSGGSGNVTVGLDAVTLDAAAARAIGALPPGPYAHLWVRDTGIGMDAQTRARIFEPFFTTKPPGRGTGLGLSVVHGIVAAHQGAIAVDSAPGQGSTFHLYFPAQAQAPGAATPAGPLPADLHGHGQHVLYVDDDDVMLLMVERLLQRLGYRATCCSSAQEALAVVRSDPRAIDVVVTDYNMPDTSGLDLAQALSQIRPDLPVLISSGYVPDELRAGATRVGIVEVFHKEDTFEELPQLLSRVLAE